MFLFQQRFQIGRHHRGGVKIAHRGLVRVKAGTTIVRPVRGDRLKEK